MKNQEIINDFLKKERQKKIMKWALFFFILIAFLILFFDAEVKNNLGEFRGHITAVGIIKTSEDGLSPAMQHVEILVSNGDVVNIFVPVKYNLIVNDSVVLHKKETYVFNRQMYEFVGL